MPIHSQEIREIIELNFGKHVTIKEDAYAFIADHCQLKTYKPREFLVEAGAVERFFYLVVTGVQAVYLINSKGEKAVMGFTFHGDVSGVYDSFIYQKPSSYFLEALTPSTLLAITRGSYEELFERFPEFLKWRIKFMEGILFGRGFREVEMLTLTAKERFDAFMKRCPPELLQIPQKYLASYLNMKPETFSRLRAQRD